jgi:hypothetical protein
MEFGKPSVRRLFGHWAANELLLLALFNIGQIDGDDLFFSVGGALYFDLVLGFLAPKRVKRRP